MTIFYLKGYAPIIIALNVEQRIINDLLNHDGIVEAQLLDENGLVVYSASHDNNSDYSSIIAVMENSPTSQSITITSQYAILIANRLNRDNLLVTRLQASCNLGLIRMALSKVVADLNALRP